MYRCTTLQRKYRKRLLTDSTKRKNKKTPRPFVRRERFQCARETEEKIVKLTRYRQNNKQKRVLSPVRQSRVYFLRIKRTHGTVYLHSVSTRIRRKTTTNPADGVQTELG